MKILQTLRSLAVSLPERDGLYIRSRDFYKTTGASHGWGIVWQRRGILHPVSVPAPRTRAAPNGFAVYYSMEDVKEILAYMRSRRGKVWTDAEWEKVETILPECATFAEAGERVGRSGMAVKSEACRRGRTLRKIMLHRHGLLTMHRVSRITRKSIHTVRNWFDFAGLPVEYLGPSRNRYVRLPVLRAWLLEHWTILVGLEREVLAMLKIDLRSVERKAS